MKLPIPVVVGAVALSACSTVAEQSPPAPEPSAESQDADAAWIEANGPSAVPREGWVETVSGWYRSRDACLRQHRTQDATGTPLSVAEECLEPGR